VDLATVESAGLPPTQGGYGRVFIGYKRITESAEMRSNAKFVCAAILFGVLGAALLNLQQRTQPSIFLPAAAQKQALAQLSDPSPGDASAPVPPQANGTQPAITFRKAPVDMPGESGAQAMDTRPQVTFQNGLLGIRAENSTMADVLRAVQRATGASIDFPGFASERVNVNLGPGALRDIVMSLLDGSRYDYILLASQQSNSIERIVLTMRRDSGRPSPASNTADGGQQPTIQQQTEAPQPPLRNMKQIVEQQQLQFEKQFGACIIQGCDAS
jgi:hypothetical protein